MKELELNSITSQQSFINYCFQNNNEDIAYWENWLKENPEHKAQIEELKTSILLLPIPASIARKVNRESTKIYSQFINPTRLFYQRSPEFFKLKLPLADNNLLIVKNNKIIPFHSQCLRPQSLQV